MIGANLMSHPSDTGLRGRWSALDGCVFVILAVVGLLRLAESLRFQPLQPASPTGIQWAVIAIIAGLAGIFLFLALTLVRRRPIQFRLITLLAAMTVVAIMFGWFRARTELMKQQNQLLEAIEPEVSGVTYMGHAIWRHRFPTLWDWIDKQLGEDFFFYPTEIGLSGEINEETYRLVRSIDSLETLDVSEVPITSSDLSCLRTFIHLEAMVLPRTEVTEKGLADLRQVWPKCDIWWCYPGECSTPAPREDVKDHDG